PRERLPEDRSAKPSLPRGQASAELHQHLGRALLARAPDDEGWNGDPARGAIAGPAHHAPGAEAAPTASAGLAFDDAGPAGGRGARGEGGASLRLLGACLYDDEGTEGRGAAGHLPLLPLPGGHAQAGT